MIINFACRQCKQTFDGDVGQINRDEHALRPRFEKPIICPDCGERSLDEGYLTERGQTQMTEATLTR
jgi:hypothetical protein